MGAADLRRTSDDQHQPLRHHFLFARRPARVSRRHRTDRAVDHHGFRNVRIRQTGTRGARSRVRDVLALCGCDMGSSSSSGVSDRPLTPPIEEPEATVVVMPAPTAWPFILALGAALIFAGLLTGAMVSALGAVLYVVAVVGWFREVLPHEHQELVAVVPAPEVGAVPTRAVTRL